MQTVRLNLHSGEERVLYGVQLVLHLLNMYVIRGLYNGKAYARIYLESEVESYEFVEVH